MHPAKKMKSPIADSILCVWCLIAASPPPGDPHRNVSHKDMENSGTETRERKQNKESRGSRKRVKEQGDKREEYEHGSSVQKPAQKKTCGAHCVPVRDVLRACWIVRILFLPLHIIVLFYVLYLKSTENKPPLESTLSSEGRYALTSTGMAKCHDIYVPTAP
jgi:hypothetical protein